MGPGGRLRPAPRSHRNATRVEPNRAAGFIAPRGSDGLPGPSANLYGAPAREATAPGGRGPSFDRGVLPQPRVHGADLIADDVDAVDVAEQPTAASQALAATVGNTAADAGGQSVQPPAMHMDAPPDRTFDRQPIARPAAPGPGRLEGPAHERSTPNCTSPQLRRFIKSRAYVPMHELRRRFGIEGADDDVTGIELGSTRIFVGLPAQESQLLGDLLRGGEVGFELSMDPQTPIVVGVYAMRPVPRP
jgi:hypothetical protein